MSGVIYHSEFLIQIPNNISLPDFILTKAKYYGARLALINPESDECIKFNELETLIYGLASFLLQEHGISKGDRIVLLSPNCILYPVLYLGVMRAGGVCVPVTHLSSKYELEHVFVDCEPRLVICDDRLVDKVLFAASNHPAIKILPLSKIKLQIQQNQTASLPYEVNQQPAPTTTTNRKTSSTLPDQLLLQTGSLPNQASSNVNQEPNQTTSTPNQLFLQTVSLPNQSLNNFNQDSNLTRSTAPNQLLLQTGSLPNQSSRNVNQEPNLTTPTPPNQLLFQNGSLPVLNPIEDLAAISYSSGTTGLPKGCVHSHFNYVAAVCQQSHPAFNYVVNGKDVTIAPLQMSHMYGQQTYLTHALYCGVTMVVMETYNMEKYFEYIERYKATVLNTVPPIVIQLIKEGTKIKKSKNNKINPQLASHTKLLNINQPLTSQHTPTTRQSINQSTNQLTNQETNQEINQLTIESTNESTNHLENQLTNQEINQLTNKSTNESTNHPANRPSNESKMQTINQLANCQTDQPINHPTNQLTNLPTTQSTNKPRNQPTNHPSNHHILQSNNQEPSSLSNHANRSDYSIALRSRPHTNTNINTLQQTLSNTFDSPEQTHSNTFDSLEQTRSNTFETAVDDLSNMSETSLTSHPAPLNGTTELDEESVLNPSLEEGCGSLRKKMQSVRHIECSAASLLPSTVQQLRQLFPGVAVVQGYGMSEIFFTTKEFPVNSAKPSSGMLLPNNALKVVDTKSGELLGPNQNGELCFKTPNALRAYWKQPQATADIFDGDGFLKTGDIGHITENGSVVIVDRIKDVIKYKGYQISPAELEAVILTHPAVDDVAVVGQPDPDNGELPLALVKKNKNCQVDEAQLQAFVAELVAPYKRLRGGIKFVEKIEKSAAGKILRRLMREKYINNKSKL